ncbi:MAG TPA: non-canonical purine NTP pyrophosphatase [Candidatus Nanoarchaeia archaeon]|nr:non-canonical purine NTP pyrophosphatase [Candidatus Nanoarchaeia archaeon]
MELYYATKNYGKVQSLQRELENTNIRLIHKPLELPEPRSDDVKEIAGEKVIFAYRLLKKPVVSLDAGFYIHSLNGFPKAFVNFALETIGIEGILKLCEGKERNCEFQHCLAYMDKSLESPRYFSYEVKGNLSFNPKGVMQKHLWSKLSLIFIPKESNKTLAEMNPEEFLEWRKINYKGSSHYKNFIDWFLEHNSKVD